MFSVGKTRLFESASGKGEARRSAGSVEWGNITQPSGRGRTPRLQPDLATGVSKGNPADQVRRRHVALALLRPLDQQPAGTVVEIAQAEELQLLGISQAIEVEVHRLTERQRVRFEQGVGGALDPAAVARAGEEAAHQRGLACAE